MSDFGLLKPQDVLRGLWPPSNRHRCRGQSTPDAVTSTRLRYRHREGQGMASAHTPHAGGIADEAFWGLLGKQLRHNPSDLHGGRNIGFLRNCGRRGRLGCSSPVDPTRTLDAAFTRSAASAGACDSGASLPGPASAVRWSRPWQTCRYGAFVLSRGRGHKGKPPHHRASKAPHAPLTSSPHIHPRVCRHDCRSYACFDDHAVCSRATSTTSSSGDIRPTPAGGPLMVPPCSGQ